MTGSVVEVALSCPPEWMYRNSPVSVSGLPVAVRSEPAISSVDLKPPPVPNRWRKAWGQPKQPLPATVVSGLRSSSTSAVGPVLTSLPPSRISRKSSPLTLSGLSVAFRSPPARLTREPVPARWRKWVSAPFRPAASRLQAAVARQAEEVSAAARAGLERASRQFEEGPPALALDLARAVDEEEVKLGLEGAVGGGQERSLEARLGAAPAHVQQAVLEAGDS